MTELICIVCPNGCTLHVEQTENGVCVSGNRCPRGEEYAKEELTCPRRTLCSTVKTVFSDMPVLPVRSLAPVPRDRLMDIMREINAVLVTCRLHCGDIVIENVLELGTDIVATRDMN